MFESERAREDESERNQRRERRTELNALPQELWLLLHFVVVVIFNMSNKNKFI